MGSFNDDICSHTFLKEEIYGEQKSFSSQCFKKRDQVEQNTRWHCTHEGKDLKVIQVLEIWLDN